MYTLATYIKERRHAAGLSIADAAVQAGVSYWRWHWLERKETHRLPPVDLVVRIALVLDCTPADLYAAAGLEVRSAS